MNRQHLVLILAIVAAVGGVDLLADLSHGASLVHVFRELIVVTISLVGIAWLLLELRKQSREIQVLKEELSASDPTTRPGDYVLEGRKTLGQVIGQQFHEWQLTESEQAVGWLLLKGLSLREIAMVRNTREKTVRQQASAIYRKAGVSGRHTFSAWFIEDVL
ncbi:MAG: helix-turn-helix transcriptional regulator [bacterium]